MIKVGLQVIIIVDYNPATDTIMNAKNVLHGRSIPERRSLTEIKKPIRFKASNKERK